MNEIIKGGPEVLKGPLRADENVNKSKDKSKNIFESPGGEELNTLKEEFRDLILNDDSITPE